MPAPAGNGIAKHARSHRRRNDANASFLRLLSPLAPPDDQGLGVNFQLAVDGSDAVAHGLDADEGLGGHYLVALPFLAQHTTSCLQAGRVLTVQPRRLKSLNDVPLHAQVHR